MKKVNILSGEKRPSVGTILSMLFAKGIIMDQKCPCMSPKFAIKVLIAGSVHH